MEGDLDIALKNLVGDGAAGLAERWAENGKLRQKLEVVRISLGVVENNILDRLLGIQRSSSNEEGDDMLGESTSRDVKGKGKEQPDVLPVDSEDESDDGFSEDERGKTAHRLFAGLAGIEESEYAWWVSSLASQKSDTWVLDRLEADKLQSSKDSAAPPGGTGTSPSWAAQLTAVSSPVHPVRERKGSPLQISLLPGKRRCPSGSKSPSGTHLRKRLFVGDPTTSSPVLSTSPRTCSRDPIVVKRSEHFAASPIPIASSSRLPVSTSVQYDPPPSPLLEVNNYHPKRNLFRVPQHDDGISKASKLLVSDPEQSDSLSPIGDENAAGEVIRLPHAVRESRRRFSSHRQLLPIPTSPSKITRVKGEDPKVSDRRARRSKFHAQRLSIAARLAQARPDLVTATYESKREALLWREARADERAHAEERERQKDKMRTHLADTGTLLSIGTVDEDDGGMDWDRSRVLAEAIKADLADGRRPMLPPLVCAESP
jgi:hypothetical protein